MITCSPFACLSALSDALVSIVQLSWRGQGQIRGTASRLGGPVFDYSIDHSPPDISHSDYRILSITEEIAEISDRQKR
jgi:hypothetical protein